MSGKIHIYCGDGKGKTTASVGLTIRMTGAGGRTLFAQFMKNGRSSELSVLRSLERVTVVTCNTVTGFYKNMTPEQRAQASRDYSAMLEQVLAAAGTVDLLVLDGDSSQPAIMESWRKRCSAAFWNSGLRGWKWC